MQRCFSSLLLRSSRTLLSRSFLTSPFPDVPLHRGNHAQFVLANTERFPDRVAIQDGLSGNSVRYSELKTLTNNVASALAKRGLRQGQVISLFASNSVECVIAYFGIIAAGGIVNLVNSNFTVYEFVQQLKQTRPRFLLITPDKAEVALKAAREVDSVEEVFVFGGKVEGCRDASEWLEDDGKASAWGQLEVGPEDVAIYPHSSGTSGVPKVVELTHDNLNANLCQGQDVLNYVLGDICLALLPFYHIYSPMMIYGFGLRAGMKLVILTKFEPVSMLESIEKYGVTFLPLVPPLMLFLLQSPLVKDYDLSTLREVICGAAPLQPETHLEFVSKFRQINPDFDLRQGFGLTEMSPLTHSTPKRSLRPGEKEGTVGLLLPNTHGRVLRPGTEEELGPNEEGEIVLRGPQVMKGYLGNPEATNELIIKNGWLYTGDLGHYDEDGYFYVTDRLKDLIKFKGIQVAPAELEAFLLTHPAVADCCVVGKKDERAGEVPKAFVVRKAEVTEKELCAFVEEHLSDSKRLRGGVTFVAEIPKSPSGKILRRILRDAVNES